MRLAREQLAGQRAGAAAAVDHEHVAGAGALERVYDGEEAVVRRRP